ncbi:GNAT family N-acetyltransferase [Nocardioides sp. AE5]|uniref:GNAT family N-acetyltransferase n=1 Tax=Nocardioides sp. AE5 TaxID=2962573 RepID=UPI0028815B4E|nr:GNAT family N-acetyltransferase [Nocardioides sp. AE5]MDT0203364.1 GNAT family N-acetyltransferase [Nocardioides sp. AE5]
MSTPVIVRHGERELSGVARAGEAWGRAASRIATTVAGEPFAVDLSGAEKVFAVDPDQRLTLRPMTRGDLPDVSRWRSADHVARWWADDGDPDLDSVTAAYGPHLDGRTPTRMWVVEMNGRSIGFVQDYRIRDYPEFALLAGEPDAIGLDYAIGEPAWIGRGIGVRMLWEWFGRTRKRFPEASCFFAAPDHRNTASLRALAKAGFTEGVWFDEPGNDGSTATVVGCSLDVGRVVG